MQFPCLKFVKSVKYHHVLWTLWLSWNSMWVCGVHCLICPRAILLSHDSSSTTYCTLHLNGLILFTAESIFTTLLLPAVVLIPVWATEWYQELFKASGLNPVIFNEFLVKVKDVQHARVVECLGYYCLLLVLQ